jgi:GH25 family lysozyme M1 (1,4-beta-N-acetylmuramidase)
MTVRVANDSGARPDALAIYDYVQLGPVGQLIVAIAESYPKRNEIYVTSGMDGDHGPRPYGSHHYGLTYQGSPTAAVDFGARDVVGVAEGDRRMRDFAKWCEDHFYRDTVELIHTTPYPTDDGFYVRHGVKIATFGAATDAAHLNHVHLALSKAQAIKIQGSLAAHSGPVHPRPAAAAHPVPAAAAHPVPAATASTGAAGYDGSVEPIFGWDASDYDHDRGMRPPHIVSASGQGVRFFTHKATEHGPHHIAKHQQFGPKLDAARAAGIPFLGAYVVVRSGVPIAAQADTAIEFVTRATPWFRSHHGFFWQVDLEMWDYDAVPAKLGEQLAAELEKRTGKPVILYASHGQYGDHLIGTRPLWNADYRASGQPRPFRTQWADVANSHHRTAGRPWQGNSGENYGFHKYSGRVPVILQFASDAVIGGQHTCDANVFLGTEADFARLIAG